MRHTAHVRHSWRTYLHVDDSMVVLVPRNNLALVRLVRRVHGHEEVAVLLCRDALKLVHPDYKAR